MCDYSLHHVASRPAKVGDRLVTTAFGSAMNRGLAAIEEPGVAVCLMPGTEVAMERAPEYEHLLGPIFPGLRSRKTRGHKVARFRQVRPGEIGVHHDAFEFPNGEIVLVAELRIGQEVTVLQLPPPSYKSFSVEHPASVDQQQERVTIEA